MGQLSILHYACRVRSQDDARDTFKTLKNQLVGDGSAFLYHEWASLEHAAGNVSKALGILAKGLRSDAQPSRYAPDRGLHMSRTNVAALWWAFSQ